MPYVLKSPGHASLRTGRRSLPGQAYFLTFTTYRRERLFAQWEPAAAMSRLIHAPECWPLAQLMAWVLMPDHWHGLLLLQGPGDLSRTVGHAKGATAFMFNRALGRVGALWARGFYDRGVRRDEDLRTVARYLVANPLRAGLVSRIAEYPFWNATWLSDESAL